MRTRLLTTALMAGIASSLAHADTIQIFNFSNITFGSGATGTGSLTVDTTSGQATALDFTYKLSSTTIHLTGIGIQYKSGANNYAIETGTDPSFFLYLPVSSLVA